MRADQDPTTPSMNLAHEQKSVSEAFNEGLVDNEEDLEEKIEAQLDQECVPILKRELASVALASSKDKLDEENSVRREPTLKNRLAIELGVDPETVHKAAVAYQDTHPEWFISHVDKAGHTRPHYHPDLADLIREDLAHHESAPEGWMANNTLARMLDKAPSTIQRIAEQFRDEHPEWFETYKVVSGQFSVHYHPDLVTLIGGEFSDREKAPQGWMTNNNLAKELSVDFGTVKRVASSFEDAHPEWFKTYQDKVGKQSVHYHPDLVMLIREEINSLQPAPEGWLTNSGIAGELKVGFERVSTIANTYRDAHPEWFHDYTLKGRKYSAEHYHPALVDLIRNILDVKEVEPGWKAKTELAVGLGVTTDTINRLVEKYREQHPEWFAERKSNKTGKGSGKVLEYYHPDLVAIIERELMKYKQAPEGWRTAASIGAELGFDHKVVKRNADSFRDLHPEWFSVYKDTVGRPIEHLHPDLQAEVNSLLKLIMLDKAEQERLQDEQRTLKQSIQTSLIEIGTGESVRAKEFQSLVSLFGAERAIDILYQQHPEYQKLPVPYVKSALADYLGEFLLVKGGFSLDALEKGTPFLANVSFKEGLTEVIKNDCLRLLNELSKASPDEANEVAVAEYIAHIRQETAGFSNPELEEVLGEIEAYYQLLFENIHKPDCFVDQLDDGRLFPDINQRINVQEIAFKHKVLVADDMGMGKSASAIMAKEIIGAKQALIVVPSNVTSVWENYLSDRVGEDGEQIGYFKEGQAPGVLMVNSLEDLTDISHEGYDYIVISQERLNEKYTDALSEFDYDMLIVDEMHKLKNISSGKRSENLIRLAEQIEGEDKYLALLSGTPIPNKIGDVALTLKLLYPERFGNVDNKQLVNQILNGDMLDLRSLLVPRMQMKSLAGNVDMPELREVTRTIELSDQEKEIYDILIEEDELSASEKLVTLRQFAMNPRMLDATPDIVGSKPLEVSEALRSTFSQKDKIVMFVNGYIEGVMRGEDTIIQDLDLPADVEVLTIDGSVSKGRRIEIQNQLQSADKKILLVVSGQTADTGVDFSAAEAVYHYNEPWSIYDKQQQTARVYRPGLKSDLTVETFVAEGTIERGIHEYIGSKYQAVEKLLRGVPISEIEKGMLRQAEKQADPDIEVSPDLAKYYFSSWDKMMKIYGHVKEMGEEDFRKFLARYDRDYADSYADLAGGRSYQANVGRLSGSLIQEMIQEKGQQPASVRVLDIASGPEVLRRHTAEELAQNVISIDINRHHFNNPQGKKAVGSMVHLPIADKSIDYTNLSLALHYTSFAPSKNNYERLKVLKEVNRVLTVGGRATVSMIYSLGLNNDPVFEETMSKLGLKVISEYTGEVSSGKNFQTQVITLEKVQDCSSDVRTLAKEIGTQGIKALKFRKTDTSLRNSKKVIKSFSLGGRTIEAQLNDADQRVLAEEERVTAQMENLKQQFGKIEEIPKSEIYRSGFSRIFNGKRYVLFKRLDTDAGAVVVR